MTQSVLAPLFTWRSALLSTNLPPTAKFTGIVMSLYMSELQETIPPLREELAAQCGYSLPTIKRALSALEDAHYIERDTRGGRGRASTFFPTMPDLVKGVTREPVSRQETLAGMSARKGVKRSTKGLTDEPLSSVSRARASEVVSSSSSSVLANASSLQLVTRKRQDAFSAVAEVCDLSLDELSRTSRSNVNKIANELVALDADADEIRRRAKNWRKLFSRATLTENALLKHWARLGRVSPGGRASEIAAMGKGDR